MAAEDPKPVRLEPVEKTVDWLRLERELLVDGTEVEAVVTASSQTDRAVAFEVVDYLPANWMVADIGFRLGDEPDQGTVAENKVTFEGVVAPDEPYVVVYEVVLAEPMDADTLQNDQEFSYPEVESASLIQPRAPPGRSATAESGGEASVRELFTSGGGSGTDLRDTTESQRQAVEGMEFGTGSQRPARTGGLGAAEPVADRDDDAGLDRAETDRSVADVVLEEIETGDVSDGTVEALREALVGEETDDIRGRVSRLDSRVEDVAATVDDVAELVDAQGTDEEFVAEARRSLDALDDEISSLRTDVEQIGAHQEDASRTPAGVDLGNVEEAVADLRSELDEMRERHREDIREVESELRDVHRAFEEWETFRETLLRSLESER